MNTNRSLTQIIILLRSLISSSSSTTEQQKLLASDEAANDNFARSISVYNNRIAVGASYDDTTGGTDAGK